MSVRVTYEPSNGYGDKLIISSSKWVEINADGGTAVYGTFQPNEVAELIRAAYRLGKEKGSR